MAEFAFPALSIRLPTLQSPKHLGELLHSLSAGSTRPDKTAGERERKPLRPLWAVLDAILDGEADPPQLLEWLLAVRMYSAWDSPTGEVAASTAQAIWAAGAIKPLLMQVLLWRLAKHYDSASPKPLGAALIKAFPDPQGNTGHQAMRLVALLAKKDGHRQLLSTAWTQGLTPRQLLRQHRLPPELGQVQDADRSVAQTWLSSNQREAKEAWLVACLEEMALPVQVAAVEQLLATLSPTEVGRMSKLIAWLKEHYRPASLGPWQQLSDRSRSALNGWLNVLNFNYFETLVERMTRADTAHHLDLDDDRCKKLRHRVSFWSNYSTRFRRLRICLPPETFRLLGEGAANSEQVLCLRALKTNPNVHYRDRPYTTDTEVCIFDLGSLMVIEFFRGKGSETIFLSQPVEELFEATDLSVKRIRAIAYKRGGVARDHQHLWMGSRAQELIKYGIEIDDGRNEFQLAPNGRSCKYKRGSGPQLRSSDQDRKDRDAQVAKWERIIDHLKAEAAED